MKIINNLSNHTFNQLKQGDVFLYSGCPYMKIDTTYDDECNQCYNAVDLAAGELIYFCEDETIRIVKATLTLE